MTKPPSKPPTNSPSPAPAAASPAAPQASTPVKPATQAAMSTAAATSKPASKPTMPAPPKPPSSAPRKVKTFAVEPWTDTTEGQKIVAYGPSGIGKTSLAATAPNPIFVGIDDGGRKIRNPLTGEPIKAIQGVETFDDLRDVVKQYDLFPPGSTFVLDTITKAEVLGEHHTFNSVKTEGGAFAKSIEDYGYGKGYRHLTETMRLLLTDLDGLVRRGVHVLLLAQQGQATVANLEGVDYMQDGPKLYHNKNGTGVRSEFCEWADHILRIGHQSVTVATANKKATKGKVSGSTDRVIFTTPELHYLAKNRMNGTLPSVVSFDTPADRSIWQFIFEGATQQETE